MWRNSAFSLLAAIAIGPGCAWITQNQAASAEYARQVSTVSLRAALLEDDLNLAEGRLSQLEEAVRTHGQTEASRLETMDEVNAEIGRLRGQIEDLQFKVGELQRFLDADAIARERRQLHAERRLAEIEKFLRIRPPPPPTDEDLGIARDGVDGTTQGDGQGTTGTTEPVAEPATAQETLDFAVEHMQAGRQGVARALLERGLQQYIGAPEMAEMRYRTAETWFNEGNFGKAASAFQTVVDNHPKSEWTPRAVLRQAECFELLGKPENAKVFLRYLIDKYPKSDAAKEARQKLGE